MDLDGYGWTPTKETLKWNEAPGSQRPTWRHGLLFDGHSMGTVDVAKGVLGG